MTEFNLKEVNRLSKRGNSLGARATLSNEVGATHLARDFADLEVKYDKVGSITQAIADKRKELSCELLSYIYKAHGAIVLNKASHALKS